MNENEALNKNYAADEGGALNEEDAADKGNILNEEDAVDKGNILNENDAADKSDVPDDKNKGSLKKEIVKELIIYAVLVLVLMFIVPKYVLEMTIVEGRSMTNTLQDSDRLFVEKLSYRFLDPDRFDIIVFYPEGRDSSEYYVKRVIGLPGETVQIKNSVIYINGEAIEDNYRKEFYISYEGIAADPVTLGDDEFFVMGDNRNGSTDSRDPSVGPVERVNVDGRVLFRVYPFNRMGLMLNK